MFKFIILLSFSFFLWIVSPVAAAEDSLRICSQNIYRYGAKYRKFSNKRRQKQLGYLITRFKKANCDIIAIQELPGASYREAERILDDLAFELQRRSGEVFEAYIGKSHDRFIRNAFLVRKSLGKVEDVKQYYRVALPRLRKGYGRTNRFSRGPLGLFILTAKGRNLFVVTMHFKSKRGAHKDPTGTKFEALRLEMAEGLRAIVTKEMKNLPSDTVLVVLGDRNTSAGSGSSEVLEGLRRLDDFSYHGCRLDKKLKADCGQLRRHSAQLIGLFTYRKSSNPRKYRAGSYRHKKREELIDEILVREKDLALFRRSDKTLAIGFGGQFYKGSDHKLLWANLDWSNR